MSRQPRWNRGARWNRWGVFALGVAVLIGPANWLLGQEASKGSPPAANEKKVAPKIEWLYDYAEATRIAKSEGKMLLVYFKGRGENSARKSFENQGLPNEKVKELLAKKFVSLCVWQDAKISSGGKSVKLLEHAAFAEMNGSEGLAIIDYGDEKSEQYGHVVSTIPFSSGKYYHFQSSHLPVLLNLPSGTLTQRTLIFAVRIHPEAPASTHGDHDPVLASEARGHSRYQAQIRNQGHHGWGSRVARIMGRWGFGGLRASEVCAESWPNETLVDAAVDCVDSWRHSPGHWSAVRAQQVKFGYDMKRGSNGIWYATGIFGGN